MAGVNKTNKIWGQGYDRLGRPVMMQLYGRVRLGQVLARRSRAKKDQSREKDKLEKSRRPRRCVVRDSAARTGCP